MATLPFFEVDVFATGPFTGNPLAVVANADDLSDEQMQRIANWTNFSETTFLLKPTDPKADYRVRIFTPVCEFPFAGHPTLGTAKVWQELGGTPQNEGTIIQECGVGLVTLTIGEVNAFATPPLLKDGELSAAELKTACDFLGISTGDVLSSSWGDNGPGWAILQLADADAVKALKPTGAAPFSLGVVGMHGAPCGNPDPAYEVRAFFNTFEDPVTGSLNGSVAQWMRSRLLVPSAYTATQGSQMGRDGVVHIQDDGTDIWVGGDVQVRVRGEISL